MTLRHYSILLEQLNAKTRGRKHSIQLCTGPEMWVTLNEWDENIYVRYESGGNVVCTLRPDNSMVVTFGYWHTQCTTKIIAELIGQNAYLRDNHIWFHNKPTDEGVLRFDSERCYIPPKKYVALEQACLRRLDAVIISPKTKLMMEIGEWQPRVTVTQKVKDVALGKTRCQNLTARDEFTCVVGKYAVIQRILEEAI